MSECEKCQNALEATDKFCRNCGNPVGATNLPAEVSEERRMLTVLFCDLVGSTQLASRLDPEETRELIQLYQAACGQEISRFGGYTAQYLGDGILVYFGYPTASEDSATQAVRCSLAMRNAMKRLSLELENTWEVTLAVRIGVHTGMVVIGDMGGSDRTERLALGEAPNIAARVQGKAEVNEILITDETRKLAGGRFLLAGRGTPALKGVEQPLELYAVQQLATEVLKGVDLDVEVLIHGRSNEMAQLRELFCAVSDSGGIKTVHIEGEAGSGKSHLLRAFLANQSLPVFEIFCSEHHRITPFWPLSSCIEQIAELPSAPFVDWESTLTGYLANNNFPPELLVGLATLLAIPNDHVPTDAASARQLIIDALLGVLSTTSCIVVCEDLQWADASTLEVLNGLRALDTSSNVFLMLTSRLSDDVDINEDATTTRIELGPVDSVSAEAIVRDSAGGSIADTDCQEIISRASGLPMFLSELARQMGNNRTLGRVAGSFEVPTSLRNLLLNQLERMGDAKRVAQEAAVLGMDFVQDYLSAISLYKGTNLYDNLAVLENAGVISRDLSTPHVTYRFCHSLMFEVTLGSLLKKSRTQIHRRIAVYLQERAQVDLQDRQLLSLLARHWERAVSGRKADAQDIGSAAGHLITSAESSLAISAYQEANSSLDLLESLIKRLPKGNDRDEVDLKLHMKRSVIHSALDGFAAPSVEADFQAARALCEKLGKQRELAQVLLSLWSLRLGRGQYSESLETAQESLALARKIDDEIINLRALTAVSNSEFWLGNLLHANALAAQVVHSYSPGSDPNCLVEHGWDAGVQAYMVLTWSSWLLGHDDTLDILSKMKELASEIDHPINRALVANTSSMLHILRSDGVAVLAASNDLIAVANEFNLGFYKMFGDMFTAAGCVYQGQGKDGFDAADGAFQFYEKNMGGLAQTFIATFMVIVYADRQQYDRAFAVAEYGLAAVERCDERVFESSLRRQKALLSKVTPPLVSALAICGERLADQDALDPADPRNVWINIEKTN